MVSNISAAGAADRESSLSVFGLRVNILTHLIGRRLLFDYLDDRMTANIQQNSSLEMYAVNHAPLQIPRSPSGRKG